jgi:nucleotide-binding universal stress UspA family protein
MKPFFIKRIMIPLDFSLTSLKALDHAVNIAKISGSEIYLLHVIENIQATTDPLFFAVPKEQVMNDDLFRISNESLNKVADRIKSKGFTDIKCITVSGRTHAEIIKMSKKLKADLIVMGTHGVSGFKEFIMGSNTYRVVSEAQCPVLSVQRKNKASSYKNILVPFTDTPHSREKVSYAIRVAEFFESNITLLGFDTGITKSESKKIALQAQQIKNMVEKHQLSCTIKITPQPYTLKNILDFAKKMSADLITVTGNAEKRDITEYFKGSLAQQLINHSELPVLSIHAVYNPKAVDLWSGIS